MATTQLLSAFALLSASLLAQYPSDGITVTVTRKITLSEPPAATISVQLNVKGSTTLEQIMEAFAPLGVKESELFQVGIFAGPSPDQTNLSYSFNVSASTDQLAGIPTRLIRIRSAHDWILGLSAHSPGPVAPAEVNWESQRAKLLPEMIAEARTRAAEIAEMAGLRLGSITGLIDPPASGYASSYPYSTTAQIYLTVRFATIVR